MAASKHEGLQATSERDGSADGNRGDPSHDPGREGGGQPSRDEAERLAELARQGLRQTADASTAATRAAQQSGSAAASCAQEITAAWARYAEEVMRHTSEASRALLRARTFDEMLEVQARLLRDTMQAFLDQSVKVAQSANRMATLPWEASNASKSPPRRS